MRGILLAFVLLAAGLPLRADESLPPSPAKYFNDYAGVVDAGTADSLNSTLEDFERQTSNQIVVAVYPKFPSDDSLDDYCYRVFQSWGVGQKDKNNGAVLFVFVQDHKMRIQTGYGLEGALPDITCKQILDNELKPSFRQGDYAGGLRAGVNAMMAATKGEYKGNDQTMRGEHDKQLQNYFVIGLWIFFFAISFIFRRRRGVIYGGSGVGYYGGWSGGGGGGFSGGGGGFSGGGGGGGGGGASGGW